MKSLNIQTYLMYAIYIVRTNPMILIFLAMIGLVNGIGSYLPESSLAGVTSTITFTARIFIIPVIYGIYYEIIEDKFTSIGKIFSTYVAGYLMLIFCMYVPIISVTASFMSSAQYSGNAVFIMLTILVFSLLYLYVIPTYYMTRNIVGSIITGMQFLAKNLINSAPVLLTALFSELLLIFSQYKMEWLREMSVLLYVIMDFSIYMIASIIDLLLFIILIYIVKNHSVVRKEDTP
jgi:hypothetical protein